MAQHILHRNRVDDADRLEVRGAAERSDTLDNDKAAWQIRSKRCREAARRFVQRIGVRGRMGQERCPANGADAPVAVPEPVVRRQQCQ